LAEIQSLARGLKILISLGQSQDGISITDLAAALHVDKGTASRLAQTLATYGFAEQDGETRRYHLGSSILSLSRMVLASNSLRESAKPFLQECVHITGECAHLGIPCKDGVLYIDQVESSLSLRVNTEIGHVGPFYATALGKILLAFTDIQVPDSRKRFTAKTITGEKNLNFELARIRDQGYAIDFEEYNVDVNCIAVPIYDYREKVIGAIGISGPASRLTPEKLRGFSSELINIGRQLSDKMHFKREQKNDRSK
jgi:IclR family KDG regulon transcriptional repressor